MRIYLAGPLFTAAEQEFNRRLAHLLPNAGHQVWLPQEREPRTKTAKAIFLRDVQGINQSDVVVANMDGPDPDSGTCWECGYAYGKKSIIAFRTDFRADKNKKPGPYNLMIWASASERLDGPFKSIESLCTKLKTALKALR